MFRIDDPAAAQCGKSRRDAGFTLVEVLVAFLIVAATAQLALMVFAGQSRHVATSDQILRALQVSESALAELEHSAPVNQEATRREMSGLWWQAAISKESNAAVGNQDRGLFSITVSVFASPSTERDDAPIVELTTKRILTGQTEQGL